MAETPLLILILYLVYIVCLLFVGLFLLVRAIKTELYNLFAIATTFILMVIDFILIQFAPQSIILKFIVNSSPFFMILFTHYTFKKGLKSPYKILLLLSLVLRIIDLVIRWIYPFSTPLSYELPASEIPYYIIFQAVVRINFSIASGWLVYESFKSYRNFKGQKIEPWIIQRYFILGLGTSAYFFQSIFVVLLPTDGNGFTSSLGFSLGIVLLIINLFFVFSYLIAWIMPQKLKDLLNRGYITNDEEFLSDIEELSEEDLMKALLEGD